MTLFRTFTFLGIAAAVMLGGSASVSADLVPGYTTGPGSQLLVANGGSGTILFEDTAALGGNDVDAPAGGRPYDSVLLNGSGLWSVGDTVNITGVAFTLVSGSTTDGTFTFDFLQGAGGSGASGAGGLASLGTRTAAYVTGTGAEVRYANFDTPFTFVADANSTTIGINFSSTGTIRYKSQDSIAGLTRYNSANGNIVGGGTPQIQRFSVAGSVTAIPEPGSAMVLGLVGLCTLARRRKSLR